MTQQPFPTTPFTPPTAPVPPADPSQEDRLLAAAAYLGYFTGFWLVVPIVVYVFRREKSRFVAHHAMRAVLLHLIAIPLSILCMLLSLAATIVTVTALDGPGAHRHDHGGALAGATMLMFWGSWLLPMLIYLLVTVLAAIRAFQGRVNKRSLLGRLSEWFLAKDRTVAADPA